MSEIASTRINSIVKFVSNPFVVALVSALLTGSLTHYLTAKRLRTEFALEATAHDVQAMEQARDEITKTLDTRLWRTRRLLQFSSRGGTRKEYLQHLAGYRESVDTWNTNLNRNLAIIEQYFGVDVRSELENTIGTALKNLNADMAVERRTGKEQLNEQVDAINDMVASFSRHLSAKIQMRKAALANCG